MVFGIWKQDIDQVLLLTRCIEPGTLFVNGLPETSAQVPLDCFRQPVISRENGIDGLLKYTEAKAAFV